MNAKMPVLFAAHGSPMNIILDNDFTRSLREWGRKLPRPKAIMVVSAHWLTKGTFVCCMDHPRTIHDFYGFPDELYRLTYPCPGSPDDARFVTTAVKAPPVSCDMTWGLDHASWAVLRHLYPGADIPVFELSLDYSWNDWHAKPLRYHYDLARQLSGLRDRGVLVMGSGNIVHNLAMLDWENIDAEPFDWALGFDAEVKKSLLDGNHEALIHYQDMGGSASLAVPTLDHYLPMVYAVALQERNEPLTFIHEGFQYGSVSMRCFQIG
ncbi:MAG TPA: 4,5-DOPA dioxygenase extradiol [Dissulfurispiraceae bacterium]|nr:4,5-DOPA dioxygenase extradiol [Dissulfurispiraceae bacterium]